MARKRGVKNRRVETVAFQLKMDKALLDRLRRVVYDTTGFIESAIEEKLERDGYKLWAEQQETLLRAGL